jgi:hypothetical protein
MHRLTRRQLAFITTVPLAWAILLLFHPVGDTTAFYPTITDSVTQWQTVHIGMMLFIPLMGGVIYVLLRGVEGRAARIGRVAILPFVLFYGAFELLVGVGTGMLVAEVDALPESQRAVGSELVEDFAGSPIPLAFTILGGLSLVVSLLAAGIALSKSADGSRRFAPLVLLAVSAPLIAIHEPPLGPIGLALFVAAALLVAKGSVRRPQASRLVYLNSTMARSAGG